MVDAKQDVYRTKEKKKPIKKTNTAIITEEQMRNNLVNYPNTKKEQTEQKSSGLMQFVEKLFGKPYKHVKTTVSKPESYGMKNTINIEIPIHHTLGHLTALKLALSSLIGRERKIDEDKLGAWQVWPLAKDAVLINIKSGAEDIIVLYLHGSGGDRSDATQTYQILQSKGLCVLAIDYRGYGDSSSTVPTETSLLCDAESAVRWIRKNYPHFKILVWGHSLGAGICCSLGSKLKGNKKKWLLGYILEAPFSSMYEVVKAHSPFNIPNVTNKILEKMDLSFDNKDSITRISKPIYILHAKDDSVIEFSQSKALYDQAKKHNIKVKLIEFDSKLKLGHISIDKYKFIDEIITNILKDILSKKTLRFYGHDGHYWHN